MPGRVVVDESTSTIMRLSAQIGSRFGVVVSQKVSAQVVPVRGAMGGAAVDAVFIYHFQTLALGNFTIRRLERTCVQEIVQHAYNLIRESFRR
ncbi:EcsC family protein [Microvirga calopogonii]|uniref:EcsC family protein n=1 Tax=Microvirga calopogonii TaxID=2078013 RepID=UPI000E0D9E32|nr:EcsC family protein [Microvirga calopogonii]